MDWLEDKYSDACVPVLNSDTTKASGFALVPHKVTSNLHGETLGQWINGPSTLGAYKLQSMFIFSSILFILGPIYNLFEMGILSLVTLFWMQ